MAVYHLLESNAIPAIRLGRRWIVTRQAYEHWEKTCGMRDIGGIAERIRMA